MLCRHGTLLTTATVKQQQQFLPTGSTNHTSSCLCTTISASSALRAAGGRAFIACYKRRQGWSPSRACREP